MTLEHCGKRDQVWGNAHIKKINITDSPSDWRKDENGKHALVWTLDATANEAYRQFVKCKCKNKDGVY